MGNTQNIEVKKKLNVLGIIMIAGVIMLILAFVLPYITVSKEHRDSFEDYADERVEEDVNITYGDMKNISLFEYGKMSLLYAEELWGDKEEGIFYFVIILVAGILAVLTCINALKNKPITTLIFDIVSFVAALVLRWDFIDRGVTPNDRYVWGIGFYVYFISTIILFMGCVWKKIDMAKKTK